MRNLALIAAACVMLAAAAAAAHDFWIEPLAARLPPGAPVVARTMIGTGFPGEELAFSAPLRRHADIALGQVTAPLTGVAAQVPSIDAASLGDGLHVLRIQSPAFQITYDSYGQYLKFLDEAQRPDLSAAHDARGLPREGIRETYFRYAKALVAVGTGAGADVAFGMPYELVALTNPYTDDGDSPMRFQVLFQGKPAPDAPAHVYRRAPDGTVARTALRADGSGVVTVAHEGPGFYLVSAILILPASARMQAELGSVWQSLWASSTYALD